MPRLGSTSSRLTRLATLCSQVGNVLLLNGHPGETISARAHRRRSWAEPMIDALFFWEPHHCRAAHERDRLFAAQILAQSRES